MARYIDADKIDYTVTMVGRDENAGYRAVAFESDIDEIPTADVVPKSEVAREIFEEIETCLEYEYMSYLKAYDYTLLTRIEELKKKYTEK